jgi:RNase P subunit RPR2
MGSEDTSDHQSALAVKAAKKVLKKQDDRSMKIRALAKKVYSEIGDCGDVNVNVDAVKLWIKQSNKFETNGNIVSLSEGKKRKRNDGVDAVPVPADHPAEAEEQGSNTGTPSSAKTVQVSSENSNNHDATVETPKVMPVSADFDLQALETAYRQADSAFKSDKASRDLRRAKSAARKAWDEAVAATQDGEQLTCKDCSQTFMFTTGEREFYTDLCFDKAPTRCQACNTAHKFRLYDRSKRDSNNGKNMCYAFQHGECKHGEKCKFSHNPEFGGTPSAPPPGPGTPSATPAGP